MKKLLTSLIVLACVVFGSGAVGAEEITASTARVTQKAGKVTNTRGELTLPVSNNILLKKGDVLKSKKDSSLDFSINGLAGVRLLGESECLIEEISLPSMRLHLKKGNALFHLKDLPEASSFYVITPTAIAGVRGTQFWGRVDRRESPVVTFAVREGTVEILSPAFQERYVLKKGEALDLAAEAGEKPVLRKALAGEMAAMEQAGEIRL